MTMTKRTQGRPPRNSGVNGREKLIEATRTYLRSHRKLSLTRTEIAQECGVTPALISYYFKDKKSLLDAVTKPLLRGYRARLGAIVSLPSSAADRMHEVIRFLIELNTDDAFLVDHMLRRTGRDDLDAEDRAAVDFFHCAVSGLVQDLVDSGEWLPVDPRLAEIALWGICRALGETLKVEPDAAPDEAGDGDATAMRTAFAYETFMARQSATKTAARPG